MTDVSATDTTLLKDTNAASNKHTLFLSFADISYVFWLAELMRF